MSYIREESKKMKDRDTLYRLAQNRAMSCCFDEWMPGGPGDPNPDRPFEVYLDQLVANALAAGKILEQQKPSYFGVTEKPFLLTSGQVGKVHGDVFEVMFRAILWNCCGENNKNLRGGASAAEPAVPFRIAMVTLGDNYDLRKLFTNSAGKKLDVFIKALEARGMSLSYSTPDLVAVKLDRLDQSIQDFFDDPIDSLSLVNQDRLSNARSHVEGRLDPSDVILACGIKTSLRSDRMYQFLFEANAWKYLWRRVFEIAPCPYHTLVSEVFGADPTKLKSLDFSNPGGADVAERVIDSVTQIRTPSNLIAWFHKACSDIRSASAVVAVD